MPGQGWKNKRDRLLNEILTEKDQNKKLTKIRQYVKYVEDRSEEQDTDKFGNIGEGKFTLLADYIVLTVTQKPTPENMKTAIELLKLTPSKKVSEVKGGTTNTNLSITKQIAEMSEEEKKLYVAKHFGKELPVPADFDVVDDENK